MMPIEKRIIGFKTTQAGGFTLIELIITMAVVAIFGLALVSNFISQQRTATAVRQVAQMQQQLRGAMFIMEQDIRDAGFDPEGSGLFGVLDVTRWSITDETTAPAVSATGSPSLTLAYDWNPAGGITNMNGVQDEATRSYRLFDDNNDGIWDLVRDDDLTGPDRQLVAEGMEAIGFAYAYETNDPARAGELERDAAGNIIWAVDSDNDNRLDTSLDANNDGVIDLTDDTNDDGMITPLDGAGAAALAAPVEVSRIRMVRIWLLARARGASNNFSNQGQSFLVGDRVLPGTAGGYSDNVRRRLLTRTVGGRYLFLL